MTHAASKRRWRGEDPIYWDAAKNCYVGAVSLGYSPSGTRIRKRVMARTKTEVRDKLKELHQQAERGVRPGRHYAVNDALDDWLATGLDGLAPSTVTVYRNTVAKALREELGTVELTNLTAGAVQKALADLAAQRSTRTVQMAHNVLVRAIRHAERDDLVGRNVAALVKPPKGQLRGRPSKSLTFEQAVALMAAAQGTRLEAYIVLSLLLKRPWVAVVTPTCPLFSFGLAIKRRRSALIVNRARLASLLTASIAFWAHDEGTTGARRTTP